MKEMTQRTGFDQGQFLGGCALAIEGRGADVIRMKTIIHEREEWHRQLLTEAFAAAEADPIQNSPGAEHAAEGTDQGEKGFRGEAHPVGAGLNRLVGQMVDSSLNCFIDASSPRAMRMAPELRGLRPLSRPGTDKAGLGPFHGADGTVAVEVKTGGKGLGKPVVRNGLDGWVTVEKLSFCRSQLLEQRQDALAGLQGAIQIRQRSRRQGGKLRHIIGIAEGTGW